MQYHGKLLFSLTFPMLSHIINTCQRYKSDLVIMSNSAEVKNRLPRTPYVTLTSPQLIH